MAFNKSPNFKFNLNMDALRERAQRAREADQKRGSRTNYADKVLRIPEGNVVVAYLRLLPPGSERMMSRGQMGKFRYTHFLNVEGRKLGVFTCGYRTDPEIYDFCPICRVLDRFQGVISKEVLQKLWANGRSVYNVLVRKIEDQYYPQASPSRRLAVEKWDTIQVFEGPVGFGRWVEDQLATEGVDFFVDPLAGRDVIVKRTGRGMDTKYEYALYGGELTSVLPTKEETVAFLESAELQDLDRYTRTGARALEKADEAAKALLAWAQTKGVGHREDVGYTEDDLRSLMNRLGKPQDEPVGEEAVNAALEDAGLGEEPVEAHEPKPLPQSRPVPLAPAQPKTPFKPAAPPPQLPKVVNKPATPPPAKVVVAKTKQAQQPEMDANTGQPVCFGQYAARNPEENPTDPLCITCLFKAICQLS